MPRYRLDIHENETKDDSAKPLQGVEFNATDCNDAADKAKILLEMYQDVSGNACACGFLWDGSNDWRGVSKIVA